jgi:hypothetical protein
VLFATDSLEFLLAGRASPFAQDLPGQAIYELEAADAFRCDMAWTWAHSGPVAEILHNACRYWAGEPKQDGEPYWEYLLTPPVRVLRRVEAASTVASPELVAQRSAYNEP